MAGYAFVQSELLQESWEERRARISQETRDLVAASREIIAQSREAIREADRLLGTNFPKKQAGALPYSVDKQTLLVLL